MTSKKFTKKQAEDFVSQLMQKIFVEGYSELIKDFYTADVVGHYGEETFYIDDIKNRVEALKNNTRNFCFTLDEVLLIDDLIICHVKQNWLDSKTDQLNDSTVLGIYRMRNRKVCELWILLDRKVASYKEVNAGFKKEMQPFELNEKTKYEFLKRLAAMKKPSDQKSVELSKVEEECLYYYFHGFSAKETAFQMGLSFRTVQAYIAHIKERFGCDTKMVLRKYLFAHLSQK